MAETVYQPNVSYPGVETVEEFTYTCGWSVSPGRIMLQIHPQDLSKIQGTGDLVLSDGLNQPITFKDCQVVDLVAPQGDSGPLILTLDDGRWRWDFGAISARYNIPLDRSQTIPPLAQPLNPAGNQLLPPEPPPKGEEAIYHVLKAPKIASMLLDAMGVKKYDVSGLNPDATPSIEWDCINPAQALGQLASDLGCVVAFDPSTLQVSILKQGDGDGLPPGELQVAPELRARPRPDVLQCRGGPDRLQLRIVLAAVGEDFDGSWRFLNQLSYRPIDNDWTKIPQMTFDGLAPTTYLPGGYTNDDAKALAMHSVYRHYVPLYHADPAQDIPNANDLTKVLHTNPVIYKLDREIDDPVYPKPPKDYGVGYRIHTKDKPLTKFYNFRLLPFKNFKTIDDTKRTATIPAKCYGRHSPLELCKLGNTMLDRYDQTDVSTEVRVPFSIIDIGNDEQAVSFAKQVYARKNDGKIFPAEIVIECAVHFAMHSGQWYRTPWELTLPNGPGAAQGVVVRPNGTASTVRNRPTDPGVIVREDVIFLRTARYEKASNKFTKIDDNETAVLPRADYYLRGESRKYELVISGDATYPGSLPMFPTGTWMQVTWDLKPTTRVSMNTEHALYLPAFADRRKSEQTDLDARRKEIARGHKLDNAVKNGAIL